MPKIIIHADCGDAPEKELPRELVIDSIITQGREGEVCGVIKTERGGSVAAWNPRLARD